MFANFRTVERVLQGTGVASRLGQEAFNMEARKVAVITDKGLVGTGIHLPLMASLEKAGVTALLYDDTEQDPSPASIEKAAAWVKENGVDLLVGLGGRQRPGQHQGHGPSRHP
ncbi:iron-containing alcohol dehydrogenase [Desulfovibrio sp.]|uniref:iron-containing alcohol dehydrogenase n=2 Tax=Desulfovibrio sp. TaxID=885 RepID=UPI003AB14986